jgi:hypothetical protein
MLGLTIWFSGTGADVDDTERYFDWSEIMDDDFEVSLDEADGDGTNASLYCG